MSYLEEKFKTPAGTLFLGATDTHLVKLTWTAEKKSSSYTSDKAQKIIDKTKKQLTEYFAGKRKTFDIPLKMNGTRFQKQVWQELEKIPYGETRSYSDMAKAVKNPNACRAVGSANGANPIAIIVPCHRVIAKSGGLGGFGGGLRNKSVLLAIES